MFQIAKKEVLNMVFLLVFQITRLFLHFVKWQAVFVQPSPLLLPVLTVKVSLSEIQVSFFGGGGFVFYSPFEFLHKLGQLNDCVVGRVADIAENVGRNNNYVCPSKEIANIVAKHRIIELQHDHAASVNSELV